jgi:hypothetical protein
MQDPITYHPFDAEEYPLGAGLGIGLIVIPLLRPSEYKTGSKGIGSRIEMVHYSQHRMVRCG